MSSFDPLDHRHRASVRLVFDQGTLLLSGVTRQFIERVWPNDLWVYDPRGNTSHDSDLLASHTQHWRTDAVHYQRIQGDLDRSLANADWCDDVPQWHTITFPWCRLHPPREDQRDAIKAWLGTRRGVVVMPTVTFKTKLLPKAVLELLAAFPQ
jgi:hypothetical protein